MSSSAVSRLTLGFAVAAGIWACGGSKEPPKIPLNQVQSRPMGTTSSAAQSPMGAEAQAALDSGNILYRAKRYDQALAEYRRSAELAPSESAPLVGILMVADVTKNKRLADSTLVRMKALSPGGADSAAAMSDAELLRIHSDMKKTAPPDTSRK
jgi:Flp pilus assembly protein TadD